MAVIFCLSHTHSILSNIHAFKHLPLPQLLVIDSVIQTLYILYNCSSSIACQPACLGPCPVWTVEKVKQSVLTTISAVVAKQFKYISVSYCHSYTYQRTNERLTDWLAATTKTTTTFVKIFTYEKLITTTTNAKTLLWFFTGIWKFDKSGKGK